MKILQDLEVLKRAVSLHDAREASALGGKSLAPLLDRYLQVIPEDPWGSAYLFDGDLGVLASLGRDRRHGGSGDDLDVIVFTRPWNHTAPGSRERAAEEIYRRQVRAGVQTFGWLGH